MIRLGTEIFHFSLFVDFSAPLIEGLCLLPNLGAIWGLFSYYFIVFNPIWFLLSLWDFDDMNIGFLLQTHMPLKHYSFFSILLLRLNNFYLSLFRFIYSFTCIPHSAIEPIHSVGFWFIWLVCLVVWLLCSQFQNSHLVLFYIFTFFSESSYFFAETYSFFPHLFQVAL